MKIQRLVFTLLLLSAIYPPAYSQTEQTELTWTGCGITKKSFMNELTIEYEKETDIKVELSGGGATKGIRDVANRIADIGGSCRLALDVSEEKDVILLPVAWDALVVVVHKDNPINNITLNQLTKVFSGDITNWSELGISEDYGKINLHVRKGKISGVGYMSRLLLFFDQDMEFAATIEHISSGPLEKAIQNDPKGIAITGISSAIRRNGLKILKLNSIEPSSKNILNGSYDLIRPLHLVVHEDVMDDGPVSDFIKFVLSSKGQKVIATSGAIPMAEVGDDLFKLFYTKMEKAELEVEQLKKDREYMNSLLDMTLEELIEIEIKK